MATSVVSSAELHTRLADPDLTIVDVRPLPAYNGWRLQGESRGGHIPGAVSFPATWLESVDEVEVERLLREKSIVSGREVVLSGGRSERSGVPEQAGRPGARRCPSPRGRLGRVGRRHLTSRRAPAELRAARPSRMALAAPCGGPAGGRTDGRLPALPRQLRGSRGVRGKPPPGRALPRHEPAREPDRLEPPLARGARDGAAQSRDHA